MAECACCGQTLPPDMPEGLKLRGKKLVLFEMVRKAGKHGVRADRIFDYLYGLQPDGGPESGIKIISIFVCGLNKKLKPLGMQVRAGRTGNGVLAEYRLENVARPAA